MASDSVSTPIDEGAAGRRATALLASLVTGCTMLLSACAADTGTASPQVAVDAADLSAGWNRIEPAGATACSDGSPYRFYVRPGDPEKLVLYLQGGGACWSLETCDPLGRPTYNVNLNRTDPARYDGIFNFERADNPLRTHTMVFAPYCSGDVHIGAATQTYQRTEQWLAELRPTLEARGVDPVTVQHSFTVLHRGFANMQAVLDWTFRKVPEPKTVLVTGSSAGSIPSPYYALRLARQYPDAVINQLGDGAGGYRRSAGTRNPNASWNTVPRLAAEPAFAGLTNENFNYEQLYIRANRAAPRIRMHAYDTAEDDVQLRFLSLGGAAQARLLPAITANQQDIRAADPEFRSFIAGGALHTILARPEFYEYRVADRSVRDWVADVAAGNAVPNVRCRPCDIADSGRESVPPTAVGGNP